MHRIIRDLEPESYPMIKRIHEKILDSEELYNDVELLGNWLVTWTGVFLHSAYHSFKDIKRYNSILFCLLQSQSYQLEWTIFSIFSGQYDVAMRELRTTLENAFYHFKYDNQIEFHNMTVEEKFNTMIDDANKDLRSSYGKQVFQNSGYQDWESVYNNVFKKLCEYVHTSIGRNNALQIDNEGYNSLLDPTYDIYRIRECIKMFKTVVKLEVRLMEIILEDVYKVSDTQYVQLFD
ncbi:hypothetical protein FHS15_004981 [Paenibacillus castaneae]|uniref:hypothetical protein n=2 Tax=Paenibacillus castaneae TaxID=474957 RepID=UPI000C9A4472|nr:hypothetical protein [Paenibacillus castaneae]NIK79814.1 hypothetical protein [Paenibacillus castaneae]